MNRLPMVAMLFAGSVAVLAGSSATPRVFAPGVISGVGDNGAAAFAPDGTTVYFMRSTGDGSTIFESHRNGSSWSKPQVAAFSGHWRDLDPSMAPDGSYLVFVSNRPASGEGTPIDAVHGARRTPGHGMNLWRVAREGDGWGQPVRLPDAVNSCSMSFAPSVVADGSLYYIGCAEDGSLHLKRAALEQGQYQTPQLVPLGSAKMQVRDPAVAPDQSFMVVSIAPAPQQPYRLAIAFATAQGWSAPQDLGDTVNAGTHAMGGQLGPDHRTLYFYSDRHAPGESLPGDRIWQVSLAPWLDAHKPVRSGA